MKINFLHATGEPFTLLRGSPGNSRHFTISGADMFHAKSSLATLVAQEIFFSGFLFRYLFIDWKKAGAITCNYAYDEQVLSTRTVIHNKLNEAVRGAGKFISDANHFASLVGKNWSSVLAVGEACKQHFFDMVWYAGRINTQEHPSLSAALQEEYPGLPQRVLVPALKVDVEMTRLLEELLGLDYNDADCKTDFRKKMREYLKIVTDESFNHRSIKKELKTDYDRIVAIRDAIAENPKHQYSTIGLARIFETNDNKIKNLFPKLTGFPVEGYRRFLLTTWACRKKVRYKTTNAALYEDAGYKDEPSFVRGCLTHLNCTPQQLVNQKWNPDMPLVQEKKGIFKLLNSLFEK